MVVVRDVDGPEMMVAAGDGGRWRWLIEKGCVLKRIKKVRRVKLSFNIKLLVSLKLVLQRSSPFHKTKPDKMKIVQSNINKDFLILSQY